jgi:hypothetical protein
VHNATPFPEVGFACGGLWDAVSFQAPIIATCELAVRRRICGSAVRCHNRLPPSPLGGCFLLGYWADRHRSFFDGFFMRFKLQAGIRGARKGRLKRVAAHRSVRLVRTELRRLRIAIRRAMGGLRDRVSARADRHTGR